MVVNLGPEGEQIPVAESSIPKGSRFPASPDVAAWWSALMAIILIELVLAGDKAVVIALAARPLPLTSRKKPFGGVPPVPSLWPMR